MGGGRNDEGFSLLEVMVALGVFAIVTVGVVPLLGSALRASSTARSTTMGEEAARTVMERIQGTKWYVSYDAKPNKRVDILDLYYPTGASNAAWGQSYSATATNSPLLGNGGTGTQGGVFTTTCPNASNPACNFDLPTGATATIEATFVKKHSPTTTPETYEMVTPPATYAWNSQGNDAPPATLMDVDVTVSWTDKGKARSYSLRAIIGERKFVAPAAVDAGPSPSASASAVSGVARMSGRATIDYVAQVNTGYSVSTAQPANGCPVAPCKSEANMTFGMSESTINAEDVGSTADQTDTVADFSVVRVYPSSQAPPPTPPPDLMSVTRSASVKHAPPYSLTATDQLSATTTYLTHPELANAQQAMVWGGENHNLLVDTNNELPQAEGNFQTFGTTAGIIEAAWDNTQIDYTGMKLDSAQWLGWLQRATPNRLGYYTKANTYALNAANRSVETKTSVGFGSASMFVFKGSKTWTALTFTTAAASVDCKSTANPATASATASWSMSFQVRYDPTNDGSTPNPSVVTGTLNSSGNDVYNGASVPDAIASLKALNPLEYDTTGTSSDIWLFEKRDPVTDAITQRGYIRDIVPLKNPPTTESADGRVTTASIDGALRVDTAQLNWNATTPIPETQTGMAFLKTSCEAVDNR